MALALVAALAPGPGCALSAPMQIEPTTTLPTPAQPLVTSLLVSDVRVSDAARPVWREFRLASFLTGLEDGPSASGLATTTGLEREVVVRAQPAGTWLVRIDLRRADGGRHAWDRLDAEVRLRFYDVSGLVPLAALDPATGEASIAFDVTTVEPAHQRSIAMRVDATVGPRASNDDWDAYERRLGIELANQVVVGIADGLAAALRTPAPP